MSSTRRAAPGTPPRQERFASSPEFERGLMANLVARRCQVIEDEKQRGLVWFLQLLSHDIGLEKLAAILIAKYPERVATRSMQKFGFKEGQIYNAEQVHAVRKELPTFGGMSNRNEYPLKGETRQVHMRAGRYADSVLDDYERECEQARIDAETLPESYPAKVFIEKCEDGVGGLEKFLSELCLDPAERLDAGGPFYFPTLIETLYEFQAEWIENKRAAQVTTELGRMMADTLDYCLETGHMVLIDGSPTTGKTFAAANFCELHPGQVRYVQTPCGNDDNGFFRAIAKSLGVSINQTSKAQQLRNRVEEVLQQGKLAIVFDSAHFLWPQSWYRDTTAGRIDWVLSALVENGVPVALVSTPLFMRMLTEVEIKCCWSGASFMGHLDTHQKLPDKLSEADLAAIARHALPDGCRDSIELLVLHAKTSPKYLGAIKSAAAQAIRMASKANRQKVTLADVQAAIKGVAIPSDNATTIALATPRKTSRARTITAPRPSLDGITAAAPPPPVRETPAPPHRAKNLATDTPLETPRFHPDLKVG